MTTPLSPLAAADLAKAIDDPVLFMRVILGVDTWDVIEQMAYSVAEPRSQTAVKACHSSSKTYTAACLVHWFLARYDDARIVTTAPTLPQVSDLLWREIRSLHAKSRIKLPDPLKMHMDLGPERYALGRASNEGVNFQGYHGRVLIVLDEATGITASEVWAAIEGIRAGGDVRVLALANPTVPSGPFFDLYQHQTPGWNLMTISAFDTPNLKSLAVPADIRNVAAARLGASVCDAVLADSMPDADADRLLWVLSCPEGLLDANPRPYLIGRRFVREMFHKWGIGHPDWDGRILGRFPRQSSNALIHLSWIEAAQRAPVVDDGGPVSAGLDVAGPGEDETVLTIVKSGTGQILRTYAWPNQDPRGEVVAALTYWRDAGRLGSVKVDSAGIGWGMAMHLQDPCGFNVQPVNVGEAPHDTKFVNLKAELYWSLRMLFAEGQVSGLTERDTAGQLASIMWSQDPRGRTVIESKEQARKRGVKSPDYAESLMLACAPDYNLMDAYGASQCPWCSRMYYDPDKRRDRCPHCKRAIVPVGGAR